MGWVFFHGQDRGIFGDIDNKARAAGPVWAGQRPRPL